MEQLPEKIVTNFFILFFLNNGDTIFLLKVMESPFNIGDQHKLKYYKTHGVTINTSGEYFIVVRPLNLDTKCGMMSF